DHVGRLPDPAREQRGVLEDRQLDVPVSGAAGRGRDRVADGDEARGGRRDVIGDAFGGLERGLLLGHDGGVLDRRGWWMVRGRDDRKSPRLNSSHVSIPYTVFCLKRK